MGVKLSANSANKAHVLPNAEHTLYVEKRVMFGPDTQDTVSTIYIASAYECH